MNKQNGTAIISEEEHIKQSVSDILLANRHAYSALRLQFQYPETD